METDQKPGHNRKPLTKHEWYSIWGRKIITTVSVGVLFGALPTYSIERTIQLNHIDLGGDLADCSGQMLALLVAVLPSVLLVLQVIGKCTEARKRRKKLKNTVEGKITESREKLQDLVRRSPQVTSGTTDSRLAGRL
ncbi:hypothetical protein QBC37DRAFT_449748 [Rhypophila decipiens]|uniref:Uncharacterized protein n=1 Tax=Rhypophila decipiens TaxID=261697 RepID=A0AAN7B1Y7_9PEZI|nr:hypothetical protein QBC37DRAFT_449748 [Rhypophila decipiens]